jgi:hypothetical protein
MSADGDRALLASVRQAFHDQKVLGDRALAQLEEADLHLRLDPEANSVAVLVKHLRGNMCSRWRDFLHSDGEKADRRRDEEFEVDRASRSEVLVWWEEGWEITLNAIDALREEDLGRTVTIRGEPHGVPQALLRQLTHYANHVGQIVLLAKHARGRRWRTLSIPRGGSGAFNRAMGHGDGDGR